MANKYRVTLTPEERTRLEAVQSAGSAPARTITHARILLKADSSPAGPNWDDATIQAALDCSLSTIHRVRQLFVESSLDAALHRHRSSVARLPKLDGEQEAHLVALACGPAPAGRARWSLRLLAGRFVALGFCAGISHETIRLVLKKTNSSRG